MSIDLKTVAESWLLVVIVAPLVVAVKIALVAALLRATCSTTHEAIRAGALLSTAGEFAFVLIPLAGALGFVGPRETVLATAIAAITMLIGPVAAKLIDGWLLARAAKPAGIDEDFADAGGSVVIVGFGRFGQIVTQTMLQQRIEVTVIDKDVESIQAAARFGFRIYYGDGTRLDVLRAAGIDKAKLVALCLDDQKGAIQIVEMMRSEFPHVRVIARAYDRRHAIELRKAGVDRFIRETFESALYFGRVTLETLGLSADEAAEISASVRRRDLARLEAQAQGDIMSGRDLLLTSHDHGVQPEPLSAPKTAAQPLSEETRAALGAGAPEPRGAAS